MILYFSATGNSEYVAKYIAHLNNDKVVNMTDYLKRNEPMNLTSETPYVIVAPVYISTMPVIVMDLLKQSKFEGNKNVYFIMTCAGSGISASAAFVKPLALELGLTYRGVEHLSMPQDYLMYFTVASKEENDVKMNDALTKVPSLAEKIRLDQDFDCSKVGIMHKLSIKPVIWMFDVLCIKPKKFYATNECIGCSLCEKVCPYNNIEMVNGKPVWGKKCCHCSACINKCPKKAIEYGKKTIGKNRYVAPKFKVNKD
jgi:NAD-dependent dihydropyrimidine dehydrogenase PreA subunit